MSADEKEKLEVGRPVMFHVADVVNIHAMEFFLNASPALVVRGVIVDFSDSGKERKKYAMLAVEGLSEYVVVATEGLKKL